MNGPPFYARPEGPAAPLHVAPRLASWNTAGHPDQLRLEAFLHDASTVLTPRLVSASLGWETTHGSALRLDVGLPDSVDLLAQHDLDNYLFPLASRLVGRLPRPLITAWATKQHRPDSLIRLEPALPAHAIASPVADGVYSCTVRTTESSGSAGYKQQIHDQLRDAHLLPEGPVTVQLAFAVGPRRNWLNLWKPTIDALGALLGPSRPERVWNPQDGRITNLGLHVQVDGSLGNDVEITIMAEATATA